MTTRKNFSGLILGTMALLFAGVGLIQLMGSGDNIVVAQGSLPTISEVDVDPVTPFDKSGHLNEALPGLGASSF